MLSKKEQHNFTINCFTQITVHKVGGTAFQNIVYLYSFYFENTGKRLETESNFERNFINYQKLNH